MTAVALLSGGLDSTVAAALAARRSGLVLALTVDYRQRAAAREIRAARAIAAALEVRHRVVKLDFLGEITTTALVDRSEELPAPSAADLDDAAGPAADSMRRVWVPNRNGLLIAIAASFAESLGAASVVVGFNREEAATFPDNSTEFLRRASAALALSTLSHVTVEAPTAELDKVAIVRQGYEIGAPMHSVWSCYEGGRLQCGRCESCRRLLRAVDASGFGERFRGETKWKPGHEEATGR